MHSAFTQDGRVLVSRLQIARTHWQKLRGLMFSRLQPGEGMLITNCRSIHCCFMLMPIDVLFLSSDGRIEHMVPEMKPWTFSKVVRRANKVMECYPGVISQNHLKLGQFVIISADGKPDRIV